MAQNRSPEGLGNADYYYLKVHKVIACEVRKTLFHILTWGCPKDSELTFEDHLKTNGMSNNTFNATFDKTMRSKIRSDTSGETFDVSLLSKCLLACCEKIRNDTAAKSALKDIVQYRNNVLHYSKIITDEISMNEAMQELQSLVERILELAKDIYSKPQEEIEILTTAFHNNINKIIASPLPITDIGKYRELVQEIQKERINLVRDKGVSSLTKRYHAISKVDPASWISGKETFDVKMVYVRLDVISKNRDGKEFSHNVGHEDILLMKTEDGQNATVTVIEGEAGSGKSTFAKLILSEWAGLHDYVPENTSIKGLESYDLILFVQCRNQTISNFHELLEALMPELKSDMTIKALEESILQLKTLILVDGFDEMSKNSGMLFNEIVDSILQKSENRFHIVITTRPLKINKVLTKCSRNPMVRLKITGIPSDRRVEFVQKLHDKMCEDGLSSEDTGRLVDYMKESQCRLGEHYRLPLNLTLLTYLWAHGPETVNSLTTATSLYVALLELLKLRVISRFKDESAIADKVDAFLQTVFEVYLNTHKSESLQISDSCKERLEFECKKLDLPFEDMCGAFFVVNREKWRPTGLYLYLSAPHKSLMEFFCANRIYKSLDEDSFAKELLALQMKYPLKEIEVNEEPVTLENVIIKLLSKDNELDSIDLAHYQNIFMHLGGLMALAKTGLLRKHGPKLIELLDESCIPEDQWLDLVVETECDPFIASIVAEHVSMRLIVRDGHSCAALKIFKDLETIVPVQVIFQTEVKYIPMINEFMNELSQRCCEVELLLNNHWKNPSNGTSLEHLNRLIQVDKCIVSRFTGNLENLETIPDSIEKLRLTIADDEQAKKICATIGQLNLHYLGVHVLKGLSPSLLKPLPVVHQMKKECGTLWFSEVDDEEVNNTCAIMKAFLPDNMKFQSVMFPRSTLSVEGMKTLITKMKEDKILVSKDIKTDSQILDQADVTSLRDLVNEVLQCQFNRVDEASVW